MMHKLKVLVACHIISVLVWYLRDFCFDVFMHDE